MRTPGGRRTRNPGREVVNGVRGPAADRALVMTGRVRRRHGNHEREGERQRTERDPRGRRHPEWSAAPWPPPPRSPGGWPSPPVVRPLPRIRAQGSPASPVKPSQAAQETPPRLQDRRSTSRQPLTPTAASPDRCTRATGFPRGPLTARRLFPNTTSPASRCRSTDYAGRGRACRGLIAGALAAAGHRPLRGCLGRAAGRCVPAAV